jgi:hypothetical protein
MSESTLVTPELTQLALWNALTGALGDVYDAHGVCAAAANALASRSGVDTLAVIKEPTSSHYDVWICDGQGQMKQDRWTDEDPFLERLARVQGAAQYEKYLAPAGEHLKSQLWRLVDGTILAAQLPADP